jgi:hypothetical protein
MHGCKIPPRAIGLEISGERAFLVGRVELSEILQDEALLHMHVGIERIELAGHTILFQRALWLA